MNAFNPHAETLNPLLRETLLDYLHELHGRTWPGVDGLTVDIVLASYAQAAASGLVPDTTDLLRQHPEWAMELESLAAESRLALDQVQGPAPERSCVAALRAD